VRKPAVVLRVINLKEGMPLVREALSRMEGELPRAKANGAVMVKFVHGYGSTGKGGEIRIAVQNALLKRMQKGEVQAVIFGENWRISDETTWELLRKWPELKQDLDLGRENKGITVVVL
jgi:hypothetical protein